MSLQALPTELHMNIIKRLDKKTQHRILLVSKMFLEATEPDLYKNIKLDQKDGRLNRLLYTFLIRPDLANSVERFKLFTQAQAPPPFSPKTIDFKNYRSDMQEAASKLSNLFPRRCVEKWLWGNYRWNQNDNELGLIFCLTTNLQHIDIDTNHLSLRWTRQLLETNWQTETYLERSASDNMEFGEVYPFQKLHTFRVSQKRNPPNARNRRTLCDCAPASPSLRILSLNHRPYQTGIIPRRLLTHDLGARLHTLELHYILHGLPQMESFIGHPNFWVNVKRLSLRRIGTSRGLPYDWSRMSTAIADNWPSLEYLELFQMSRNISARLGSFAGHEKLIDLTLDYFLLVPSRTNYVVPYQNLPRNLASLKLAVCRHTTIYGNYTNHTYRLEEVQLDTDMLKQDMTRKLN